MTLLSPPPKPPEVLEVLVSVLRSVAGWAIRAGAASGIFELGYHVPLDEVRQQRERGKLDSLDRIEFELTEQDTLIQEQVQRSPHTTVPESQRSLVRKLLEEVQNLDLGYSLLGG
jgi:hypothetical protein